MAGQDLARRHALLFTMGGLVYGSGLTPARAHRRTSVICPKGFWHLSRTLSRGLHGGKSINVMRKWRVMFTPQSRGISVSGQQVSVKVDAPPVLAALSRIEEARSTADMFPILLAPDGTIIAAGQRTSHETLSAAIEAAENTLAAHGIGEKGAKEAEVFFAELQQAGASMLDRIPGDLFFPSTQPVQHVRKIALGEGVTGEFQLRWDAVAESGSGRLEFARRSVTTRIGDSALTSHEEWRLIAA